MSKFWNNYGNTVLLLSGVIAGGVAGVLFGDGVNVVKPVGDIFLNFIFVLVVPLVLFSISSSICRLHRGGQAGRVIGCSLAVFIVMVLTAGLVAYLMSLVVNPLGGTDIAAFSSSLPSGDQLHPMSGADAVVHSVSVPDFVNLLAKQNLLPLIIFSCLLGFATSISGEKGKPFAAFLESGMEVTMSMVGLVMKVAPIGLGCYFAVTVASLGSGILGGYLQISIFYYCLAFAFFALVNPFYIFLARGWDGVRSWWRHILPPSITAFSSCSSAAAIPGNIVAAKNMGVRPEIAEAVIPFGTNIHKDGSIMSGTCKVIFLMFIFGMPSAGLDAALTVIGLAVLHSLVMGAVTGGGMTGELLLCTMLGLDPSYAGIIVIFGTIVDLPSTLVNSSSNVAAAVLVDTLTGHKH